MTDLSGIRPTLSRQGQRRFKSETNMNVELERVSLRMEYFIIIIIIFKYIITYASSNHKPK